MKRCLITGATGFIGTHVVRRFLDEGWQIISLSRTAAPSLSPHHEHIAADLHNPTAVEGILEQYKPSHLIHLAWEATPGVFWHSTENFRWIASSATLLEAFVRHGGEKAVLAGSCAEYKWENKPLDEDASPLNATTYYSASKLAFKGLAEVIAKDIPLVWARIFFPYGPDEDDSKLTSYIYREVSEDRLPEIKVPDRAVDMIHVEDVATAFEILAASNAAGTINICSGRAVLPHEIAREVAALMGKEKLVSMLEQEVQQGEITNTLQGNNQRLMDIWTATPPHTLSEGLKTYLGENPNSC
jgi:nucleoside-diphosphate-sugar epimerase